MFKKNYYYVTGHTAEGFVNFFNSNIKDFSQVIVLNHHSNTLKTSLIKNIINHFENNYNLEIICSALSNDYLDGVIIRDKSIAVITDEIVNSNLKATMELNLNEYTPNIKPSEIQLRRNKLTGKAYDYFLKGLKIHDELEKVYIDQMDFSLANKLADEFIEDLLQAIPKRNRTPNVYHRLFGTNTMNGVVNIVPSIIEDLSNRYYVKGRAGTGKSVFMKKVMRACEKHGLDIELFHCSFDPKSIDMVLVRELDFCVFDSTDPHEVSPNRDEDMVIDLYEKTVSPGTDEKFANEINTLNKNYKLQMKKGMEKLKEVGFYEKRQEIKFMEKIDEHKLYELTAHTLSYIK